ncbi:hypothetical protein [Clostridium sp. HBUAS56010]|uniref:hypothetical protein n=1 Tax=Clostridium sp. HBUAS56010 TaxID=2571127 RepID=UPI001178C1B0|nr:hypothetical protein [Clostridium sp. HBUAS56010]
MKVNKRFAVKVEDKIFKADEMTKISMEGGRVNIVCSYCSGTVVTVNARVKECEFIEDPWFAESAKDKTLASDIKNTSSSERLKETFDKIGTAAKGFNESFDTLRNSIEALNRVATETLKKYNPTGGD